jgi:hypothetical protein
MKHLWCILLALAVSIPASPQSTITSRFFGMHMWSSTVTWPTVNFGTQRIWDCDTCSWKAIETARGVYNYAKLDAFMDRAGTHGLDLIYTFGHTPAWSQAVPNDTKQPDNLQDWDDFVTNIVTHSAGRIKYWEIWNEPNATNFWTGTTAQLVTMAQRAYTIIKNIDPTALVLSPAPQGPNAYTWMDGYLAAGGGPLSNIVTFHGYVSPTTVETSLPTLVQNMRTVMTNRGVGNKSLWDTEGSWGSDASYPDLAKEADVVAKMYLLQAGGNGGIVNRFVWYGWDEQTWGTLWWYTGGIRPAGTAYGLMRDWITGSTPSACIASGTRWTCNVTRSGNIPSQFVWNTAGNSAYSTTYTHWHKLDGTSGTITGGSLTIGVSPMMLD